MRALVALLAGLALCSANRVDAAGNQTTSLPPVATSSLPGGIPRLIHQVFLSGKDALKKEAGAFRRDWWRSCQVHNPGWQYILWDQAMAEALLTEKYPWFLKVFQSLPLVVLRGDAIRPFILHAYGGVYLDLDTECLAPMDDSLSGHSLVLQAESVTSVNNAQMASVAEHPFWVSMQQHANTSCQDLLAAPSKLFTGRGQVQYGAVLEAAGPVAESRLLRAYLGLAKDANLPGQYPDAGWSASPLNTCALPGNTCDGQGRPVPVTAHVYSPKQWFQACQWNQQKCPVDLTRCTPVILALNAARSALKQTANAGNGSQALAAMLKAVAPIASAPGAFHIQLATTSSHCRNSGTQRKLLTKPWPLLECACQFGGLVGAHHFSGTWMRDSKRDEVKLRVSAAKGLISWMSSPQTFVEVVPVADSLAATLVPPAPRLADTNSTSTTTASARQRELDRAMWPLLAPLADSSQPLGCHMLSVTQFQHPISKLGCCHTTDSEYLVQSLVDLAEWARAHSCTLTIVTDLPGTHAHLAQFAKAEHIRLRQQHLTLPLNLHVHKATSESPVEAEQANMIEAKTARTLKGSMSSGGALELLLSEWKEEWPDASKLDVLHVSGPSDMTLLAAADLPDIEGLPRTLLLDVGVLHMSTRPALAPAYQHLYQELGYQGHYHYTIKLSGSNTTQGRKSLACADCFVSDDCGASRCLMPAMRLGLLRRTALTSRP